MFERNDVIHLVWHQNQLLGSQAIFATAFGSLEDTLTKIRGNICTHGESSSLAEAQQGLSFRYSYQMLQVLILLPLPFFFGS